MAGPWEDYQSNVGAVPLATKPWEDYSPTILNESRVPTSREKPVEISPSAEGTSLAAPAGSTAATQGSALTGTEDPNFLESISNVGLTPLRRAVASTQQQISVGKGIAGGDSAEASKSIAEAATRLRKDPTLQYPEDMQEKLEGYQVASQEGFASTIGYLGRNPDVFTTLLQEQAGSFASSILGSAVGAGTGAVVGSAVPIVGTGLGAITGLGAGAFVGSGLPTALSVFEDYVESKDIDITNEKQIKGVFDNPETMREARDYMAKYGVVVGTIDALFSVMGAKGVGPVIGKTILGPAKTSGQALRRQIAGSTLLETTGSGVGEALGSLAATGKVNVPNVYEEIIFGLPGSVVEAGIDSFAGGGSRRVRAPTDDEINEAFTPTDTSLPTTESAEAEGRTVFGFAEGDGPTEVGNYDAAEVRAGQGDLRRGKLIAVRPEEVIETADPIVTIEELTTANNNSDEAIKRNVRSKLDVIVPELRTRIMQALDAKDNAALSIAVNELPRKRVFVGDTASRAIQPKMMNLMGTSKEITFVDEHDGTVVGSESITNDAGGKRDIDLDLLQRKAEEANAIVIPVPQIKKMVTNAPAMLQVVDDTFTFTTPEAREALLTSNHAAVKQHFLDGNITWKRFDSRFLLGSGSRQSLSMLGRGETKINPAAAQKILESARVTIPASKQSSSIERTPVQDRFQFRSTMHNESKVGALWSEARTLFASGDVTFTKLNAGLVAAAEKIRKRILPNTRMVYVVQELDGNLDPGFVAKYPTLAREFKQDLLGAAGVFSGIAPDMGIILLRTTSRQSMWATLMHELGHAISAYKLYSAPIATRLHVFGAYRRFMAANPYAGRATKRFRERRFSHLSKSGLPLAYLDATQEKYYMSMEEWFAEQVARWGTSNARPLGVLGRFFRSVAQDIIRLFKSIRGASKLEFRPEVELENWLNSMYDGSATTKWFDGVSRGIRETSLAENRKYDSSPVEAHPSSGNVRSVLHDVESKLGLQKSIFGPTVAQVDKFNWFYEWALNLRQLANRNPDITELQLLNEIFELAKNDAANIMTKAETVLAEWRQLGETRAGQLGGFLFAMNDMTYLSAKERAQGVRRWPTGVEFTSLVGQHKLDRETLATYVKIRNSFLAVIKRQEELQLADAVTISDPALRASAIKDAQDTSRRLISAPYFPQTRFGKWSLTVRVKGSGKLEHFELFESKRELASAMKESLTAWDRTQFDVLGSTVPQESMPFVGVPPWMLDKIRAMPGLTPSQLQWMEQFRYLLAPSRSFRKHLLKRKNYAGYSLDARRVFASYQFHHARNYARIKHDGALRAALTSLSSSVNPGLGPTDISDRKRMADFAERIYKEFVNPSTDWSQLRALTAIWHLGFVPASAAVNLTQTIVATAPHLNAKFGFLRGDAALMKAAGKLTTYYRKGNLANTTSNELKALNLAMEQGIIDESQAAELAATAIGSGLSLGNSVLGDQAKHRWLQFSNGAMYMFRMAEQWNRRVTFRAAWQLAYDNPTTKWLTTLRQKHFLEYNGLLAKGLTDREAMAYLSGKDTVVETHFNYDALSRPRFTRGRKSVLFAFYMFTQNSLFMLWNNKDMVAGYMLRMALLAGVMGLVPDDVEDLIRAIAYKTFGKDFNLDKEARKLVVDLLGEDSELPPDLLLHGSGRYGFGIPAVMRMLGAKHAPDVDMSRALSLSRVLPMNPQAAFVPGADWNSVLAKATEGVAGAAFSIPLALAKAASSSDMEITDFKRWEAAMPRALRQTVRSTRQLAEGGERDRTGAQYIDFDRDNPEHMGELIVQAMGFRPTRLAQEADESQFLFETQAFWAARRGLLLDKAYRAKLLAKDDDAYRSVIEQIRKYNDEAPDAKLRITMDTLKRSFKTRMARRNAIEAGGTPGVAPGIQREGATLYPEIVDERRVK